MMLFFVIFYEQSESFQLVGFFRIVGQIRLHEVIDALQGILILAL